MEALRYCTLTGADEATDIDRMASISKENPLVEWGILCSRTRQVEEAGAERYPRMAWINAMLDQHEGKMPLAIHLCGKDAVDFVKGDKEIVDLANRFGRVQLNVRAHGELFHKTVSPEEFHRSVTNFMRGHQHDAHVILQRNENNEALFRQTRNIHNLEFLFDGSGGRGIEVKNWPRLDGVDNAGSLMGNAGGLGPDNIASQLPLLSAAANDKPYWIDMENKLRTAGRFDLDLADQVSSAVMEFVFEQGLRKGAALKAPATVDELDGFWLDWFAGAASGHRMVLPPENACRAMTFSRVHGIYSAIQPTEYANDVQRVVGSSDASSIKRNGTWVGITADGLEVNGTSRDNALLKAVVLETFGHDLPLNPAINDPMLFSWLGESFADLHEAKQKSRPRP